MERMRRRIESPADINEITDTPVIGRLPRQRSLQRQPASLVWSQDRMTGLQESFRALRTNVQFLAEERRLIEVTSPNPAQGKSTVVANLGVALAQIGIETVIVDADLRRPSSTDLRDRELHRPLDAAVAARPADRAQAVRPPNLWIVPSGPVPPDPTEMLHVRFANFVARLQRSRRARADRHAARPAGLRRPADRAAL